MTSQTSERRKKKMKNSIINSDVEKIWYYCPYCGQKLLKYGIHTGKSRDLYILCKKCRREIEVNINIHEP